MKEIWKKVDGFPTYYVSNTGRVKRITELYGEKMLRLTTLSRNGNKDIVVSLQKRDYRELKRVSYLVANAFLDGCGKYVRHKDGDGENNSVDNLYYTDERKAYNIVNNRKTKVLYQYTLKNELVETYSSLTTASDKTGFSPSGICNCCLGRQRTCGGFVFSYKKH